ncbi:MAG: YdcF family protein [Alphaproteobacteria bacterium]|nr:YdcF family protein [Alphaproteobacteria bacterium]
MSEFLFWLSKAFWLVAEPGSLLLAVWLAGVVLLFTPWWRRGRLLVLLAAVGATSVAMLPIGQIALKPIEDQFPPPATLPTKVDGILVLGGVVDEYVIGKRGIPKSLAAAGSPRLDAFLELSKRYPLARHVFTGGSITLIKGRDTEADVVRRIFARLGVDTTRIVWEDRSRNTLENATFSRALLKPEPGQTWLLITSARHMPRAVGTFRKAGWTGIVPFPVDFATDYELGEFEPLFRLGANLSDLSEAIREYVGLTAYYFLGRTNAWLPAPNSP